jgi:hypothetical protein
VTASTTDYLSTTSLEIEWIWDADWFSDQKPILENGCFYAWQGYWANTIEKHEKTGKDFFNWGYAGPFVNEVECKKWIDSNDPDKSLSNLCFYGQFECCTGGQPKVLGCQPECALTIGLKPSARPHMLLRRAETFPIGNGIDPPWKRTL